MSSSVRATTTNPQYVLCNGELRAWEDPAEWRINTDITNHHQIRIIVIEMWIVFARSGFNYSFAWFDFFQIWINPGFIEMLWRLLIMNLWIPPCQQQRGADTHPAPGGVMAIIAEIVIVLDIIIIISPYNVTSASQSHHWNPNPCFLCLCQGFLKCWSYDKVQWIVVLN